MIDNLDSLGSLPLIDAVIPESLAERAASIYRLISQRTEINKKIMPQAINQTKQNTDGEIIFNGHKSEVRKDGDKSLAIFYIYNKDWVI